MATERTPRYKGFSSLGNSGPNTAVYDKDLVKSDLLNMLNTRYREVPGRPGFGSSLYNMLAEPFDDKTEIAIRDEVERILRYDPRIALTTMDVATDRAGLSMRVSALVSYVELGEQELIDFAVDIKG